MFFNYYTDIVKKTVIICETSSIKRKQNNQT